MPEIFLLLFSFEGAILHKDSAEQIFIGEAEEGDVVVLRRPTTTKPMVI